MHYAGNLNTDAIVLPAGDGQALVTAMVRDAAGRPVVGVEVGFASNLGSVSPAVASTNAEGVVTPTFTAGGEPGQAAVTAECEGLTQHVWLQLDRPQSKATPTVSLQVGAEELVPGGQTNVTATVRDRVGQPIGGELVTLFDCLGELSPSSGISDENGQVRATFTSGSVPGQATITVLAGYSSNSTQLKITTPAEPQQKVFLPLVLRTDSLPPPHNCAGP